MKFDREILKGHLTTIVLAVLEGGPCHAYSLNNLIMEKSLGVFSFNEGTVYPTLHKLEKDGLIQSEWQEREKGPKVRLYSLTSKGKKTLEEQKKSWNYFYKAMNMILNKTVDKL